jgi:hypothetical protein
MVVRARAVVVVVRAVAVVADNSSHAVTTVARRKRKRHVLRKSKPAGENRAVVARVNPRAPDA